MKKLKLILGVALAGLVFTSCNDEADLTSKAGKKTATVNGISVGLRHYQNYNGETVQLLKFDSYDDFIQAYNYLREVDSLYMLGYINQHTDELNEFGYVIVNENSSFQRDYKLKQFENSLSFTQSMRVAFREYEDLWMQDTNNPHPVNILPFGDEKMSLLNKYGEVMFGDTIAKFTNNGWIRINDGDFNKLINFNAGDETVSLDPAIDHDFATLDTPSCLSQWRRINSLKINVPSTSNEIIVKEEARFDYDKHYSSTSGQAFMMLYSYVKSDGNQTLKPIYIVTGSLMLDFSASQNCVLTGQHRHTEVNDGLISFCGIAIPFYDYMTPFSLLEGSLYSTFTISIKGNILNVNNINF